MDSDERFDKWQDITTDLVRRHEATVAADKEAESTRNNEKSGNHARGSGDYSDDDTEEDMDSEDEENEIDGPQHHVRKSAKGTLSVLFI